MKLIECVPNISEGRDKKVINDIVSTLKNYPNIHLLDVDSGQDTNRTVITFIGSPEDIVNGAFDLINKSLQLIDMSKHSGEHPRMGATDVCPLVPIKNTTMEECIKYSKILAEKVAQNLDIPIFLYEYSASSEERKNLSNIRSGEFEGMSNKIKMKQWKPDYGPT